MYKKLVALKEWCDNADEKVFWLGFITATSVILIGQLVLLPILTPDNTIAPVAEISPSFEDVPPNYWSYEEIELVYSYGITVGCSYDPPLFCPDRPMTRAETAVFAARIIELIKYLKE